MSDGFEYVFPAIRGIQAQREYYVSMCPMRLLPKLFHFDEEELSPELRAQRQLNKARVPELSRYIMENFDNYVFSAITVSIDAEVAFERVNGAADESRIGLLRVPMTARFIVNDGQHRRAAIERALRDKPELGDENDRRRILYGQGSGAVPADVCRSEPVRHSAFKIVGYTL